MFRSPDHAGPSSRFYRIHCVYSTTNLCELQTGGCEAFLHFPEHPHYTVTEIRKIFQEKAKTFIVKTYKYSCNILYAAV